MTFWIALKNLKVRWMSTLITMLVVALATSIALVVPLVSRQVERGAQDAAQVFDLLITAKGSPTQAILSSLFYLDVPIGNIPYSEFQKLKTDDRTRRAVPLGFGDNYAGFPVVGTSPDFFTQKLTPTGPDYFQVSTGKLFQKPFETVIGANVAAQAGLHLGSTFQTSHGTEALEDPEEEEHHEQQYTVVGILKPTGGPADRAVLTPMETLWEVHGIFDPSAREVTAILYTGKSLADLYNVAGQVNRGQVAQAVFPGQVFGQMRSFLLQGQAAYGVLAVLVLVLAALTVWLSIYAAGIERLKSVAVLRALGAGRNLIFNVVLLETLLTVTLGVTAGILLAYLLGYTGGQLLGGKLGFSLPAPEVSWPLLFRVLMLVPLGIAAAFVPALKASRESVLRHL
ncbi:FtsX-like permease family protein [Deinococcus roseus]|uniref:ABC transporter permease n=1 Tax=Deinococcus roseus TaxID=392414 RepID=A0ABQ2CY29_9DEIO|nr:ABC transporter permease [Deinococcus roseus]GGJ32246.1 ABC transporter permease [Deinococcus roseus]